MRRVEDQSPQGYCLANLLADAYHVVDLTLSKSGIHVHAPALREVQAWDSVRQFGK